jgi:chemotaxis signal transduction protein
MGGGASNVVDLLRRRAERLAAPVGAPVEAADAELAVAEFSLGDARYALPFSELRAALPLKDVTPVPLAPAHLIGVLRFKGQAISALSLASLLGIRGWRRDPAVLLVVATARKTVAIDSEMIPKLVKLPRSAVEAGRVGTAAEHLREIARKDGEILNLLDLGRLLATKSLAG